MGCDACGKTSADGTPRGCGSKGSCATGSCNRLSTYDWLSAMDVEDARPYHVIEVAFKEGCEKNFYRMDPAAGLLTGDYVAVEAKNGYDIGRITLSGELVRLQMKKKRVQEKHVHHRVLRLANGRDRERIEEARLAEKAALVRARAIAYTSDLKMKISDVQYQGDLRKAVIYYTADGRIDFRDLVRAFATEFRIKIEMRQIGARQEAGRIGGIGSCGRELCCSTWLTDFKSVNTSAARYQNLAINQAKLSGQCGRLKCCLNYELDTYVEAMSAFPKRADKLKFTNGTAVLVKTDIFKQLMYYTYREGPRGGLFALPVARVHEVVALNKKGELAASLESLAHVSPTDPHEDAYKDELTGAVELPPEEKRRRKSRSNRRQRGGGKKPSGQGNDPTGSDKSSSPGKSSRSRKRKLRGKGGNSGGGNAGANNPGGQPGNQGGRNKAGGEGGSTQPKKKRNNRRRKPKSDN